MLSKGRLMLALMDAFRAGVTQGEDIATCYEYGCYPRSSDKEAFEEMFQKWETGYDGRSHIRKALRQCN